MHRYWDANSNSFLFGSVSSFHIAPSLHPFIHHPIRILIFALEERWLRFLFLLHLFHFQPEGGAGMRMSKFNPAPFFDQLEASFNASLGDVEKQYEAIRVRQKRRKKSLLISFLHSLHLPPAFL